MSVLSGDAASPGNRIIFRKTKLCKFYSMGRCQRGGACSFAHNEGELQALPDFSRTRLCPDLLETGRCPRGAECSFAHGEEELRNPTSRFSPTSAAAQGKPSVRLAASMDAPPAAQAQVRASRMASQAPPAEAPLLAFSNGGMQQLLLIGQPMMQQNVPAQAMFLPYAAFAAPQPGPSFHVPVAACEAQGVGQDDSQGQRLGALHPQKEPATAPAAEEGFGECLADFSPKSTEDLEDLQLGAWSRQTTEEGFGECLADFSRQSTEGSRGGSGNDAVSEERVGPKEGEEPETAAASDAWQRCGGKVEFEHVETRDQSAPTSHSPSALAPLLAAELGFELICTKTFLDIRPQPPAGAKLRRVRSAGELTTKQESAKAPEPAKCPPSADDPDDLDDLELGAWSRQSTEEGIGECPADFSRQSTEEAWEGFGGDGTSEEQGAPKEAAESETAAASDAWQAPAILPPPLTPILAAEWGLELSAAKTFLHFKPRGAMGAKLPRTHSTGDLLPHNNF